MSLAPFSAPTTIRAAATALTGSLVNSSTVDTRGFTRVSVFLDYTKGGSATLLEAHPELSYDGTTWFPAVSALSVGTPSGGAVAISMEDPTYTLAATGKRVLHFETWGAQQFRVGVRETGTPGGTCRIDAACAGGA